MREEKALRLRSVVYSRFIIWFCLCVRRVGRELLGILRVSFCVDFRARVRHAQTLKRDELFKIV